MCPALVQLGAAIFTEYFENGDGLLTVGSRGQSEEDATHKMFRLLLTDSGHYILATDGDSSLTEEMKENITKDIMWYEQKIYEESSKTWKDVRPPIFCYYQQEQSARSDRGEVSCDERTPGGDAAIAQQEKNHSQATKLPHEEDLQQEPPVDIFHSAEDEDDYWQVGFPTKYMSS